MRNRSGARARVVLPDTLPGIYRKTGPPEGIKKLRMFIGIHQQVKHTHFAGVTRQVVHHLSQAGREYGPGRGNVGDMRRFSAAAPDNLPDDTDITGFFIHSSVYPLGRIEVIEEGACAQGVAAGEQADRIEGQDLVAVTAQGG